MQNLDQLGTTVDQKARSESPRVYQISKVQKARAFIYKGAKPINGANVEALLKDFSGVPTIVSVLEISTASAFD